MNAHEKFKRQKELVKAMLESPRLELLSHVIVLAYNNRIFGSDKRRLTSLVMTSPYNASIEINLLYESWSKQLQLSTTKVLR